MRLISWLALLSISSVRSFVFLRFFPSGKFEHPPATNNTVRSGSGDGLRDNLLRGNAAAPKVPDLK
ncbi:hypothetical protein CWE17_00235 [Synechococcus sp. BS56D]|nr:hypothetical protein CWE17_00235 [Synechococcus sp. BS56D]